MSKVYTTSLECPRCEGDAELEVTWNGEGKQPGRFVFSISCDCLDEALENYKEACGFIETESEPISEKES